MPNSPDVMNYFSGTGICYFKRTGESEYRDLGNAPAVSVGPVLETREHKTSRAGSRSVDRIFTTSKKGELKVSLDEITPENLALFFLGDVSVDTAGNSVVSGFTNNSVTGAFRIVGTNEIGSKYQFDALNVQFIPSGEFSFIADEESVIELTANISQDDDGNYFTITELADEVTA